MLEGFFHPDRLRHEVAAQVARNNGLLKQRTEIWLAVSEDGKIKVAEKVLSRAPIASNSGVWNLPMPDLRILISLKESGFKVKVLLHDEFDSTVTTVELLDVLANGKDMPAKPGQADYWQFKVYP